MPSSVRPVPPAVAPAPAPIEPRDVAAPRVLSRPAAEAWLPRICFTHGPPRRIGVELEFVLRGASGPGGPAERAAALAAIPVSGRLTVEPGGQLELSTAPADDLPAALHAAGADLEVLRRAASSRGVALAGVGVDPAPGAVRVAEHPRYRAMEEFLDRHGPAGRMMMRSTASVQVNVEAATSPGDVAERRRRWELLHAVGPALVAAFANSPFALGRATGWRSTRQAIWLALDRYRTRAPRPHPGETVEDAWTRWCLDAPVMMVRRPGGRWRAPEGLTFGEWIVAGRRAVPDRDGPTPDDLDYHLTTLFPPVRARGHYEVRYLDAQPGDWWQAPTAVIAALVDDPGAADAALDACAGTRDSWARAAKLGPSDPGLAVAAAGVLEAAARALRGDPGTVPAADVVERYLDTWTLRGRCPADDLLDGRPVPDCPPPPAPPGPAPAAPAEVAR